MRVVGAELSKITATPHEPVAAEVARRLLDYLFSGAVVEGDRIPSERRLAELLGVSRPAVREGIRALGFLGLLDVRLGSGTYFRGPDQDLLFRLFDWTLVFGDGRLLEVLEGRAQLEISLAGLAADRRTDDDLRELHTLLERMRAGDPATFADADVAFHLRIADAARNAVLADMLKGVRTMIRSWVARNVETAATTSIAFDDHVPVYDAIASGDPERARAAMASHMTGAQERLLATLETDVEH